MPEPMVPVPARGRRFTTSRRVRWGDADRHGRLRLDAVARYLQDVANDDTRDVGHDPLAPWVVRRTEVDVVAAPAIGERLALTTFSGGLGSRWAERRTLIVGEGGGHVEAAATWIFVDPATGRPARLTEGFLAAYEEAAGGRRVAARLVHPAPPAGVGRRPWALRSTDLDPLGHVNNAATWEAIEDELDRRGVVPGRAALEYGDALAPGDDVELASAVEDDGVVAVWLLVGGAVRASARVHPAAG